MHFTPDALALGPLSLEWTRLGVIVGVLVFTTLVARLKTPRLERGAWMALAVGFIAARLAFALTHAEAALRDGPLGFLDVRAGGWNPLVGFLVGAAVLLWQLGRDTRRVLPAAALGGALMLAPALLKPALQPALIRLEPEAILQRLEPDGRLTPVRWAELPPAALVNVWATWCGPCRQEMPSLAEYAQRGAPVYLLNDGEPQPKVQAFLKSQGLQNTGVFLDPGNARAALAISALPTTLEIRAGRVTGRHLGPLNRAQLEAWLTALHP